jgi:sporulation integral membrane protein YtvI
LRVDEGLSVTKELKNFLWLGSIGVGLVAGLKYLFPLLAPFLLGIIFACIIEPVVHKLEGSLKIGRKPAISAVLGLLVLIILSLTTLTIITSYQEALRLMPKIPLLVKKLLFFSRNWPQIFKGYFPMLNGGSVQPESMDRLFRSLVGWVLNFLPNFPQVLLAIVLGGVTAYFFGKDKQLISRLFYRNLPKKWQAAALQIKEEFITTVARFIRAELSLVLITAVGTILIFYSLGIPGALAYGFLTGILDFVPVLGPGMVYIPLAAVYLLFQNYHHAIWLVGGYFLILLIRQVAEVKLIGKNLNIHPLLIIFVVYAGMKIFGFAGIFFGPVIIITLRAFHRALVAFET